MSRGPSAPVAVRVFAHARGNVYMRQIADLLVGEMQRLGVRARRVGSGPPGWSDTVDVVVAPHEYATFEPELRGDRGVERMASCVAITTEQPGTVWFDASRWLCRHCPVIADLNEVAAELLAAHGCAAEPLQFGHTPLWDRWGGNAGAPRGTDVAVLAAVTPHRARALALASRVLAEQRSRVLLFDNSRPVLETDDWFVGGEDLLGLLADTRILLNVRRDDRRGYFEWIRNLPAVLNGAVLVSEPSAGAAPLTPFEHFVPVEAATLGAHVTALLDDEPRRARLARAAYEALRSVPPFVDAVRRLLERSFEALGVAPPVELARPAPATSLGELRRPGPVPGRRGGPGGDDVTEVVLEDGALDAVADLGTLRARIEAAETPLVLLRGERDRLAPRGMAALLEALRPDAGRARAVAAYGITVAEGENLANHLPWDPARVCRTTFLRPPVLVRRDAFGAVLREAAAVLSRHCDLSTVWSWHLPWIVLAARGHEAVQVPAIIGWSPDPAHDEPVPDPLRRSFPRLPWPEDQTDQGEEEAA